MPGSVVVIGSEQVVRTFMRMAERAGDFAPALERVGDVLMSDIERQLDSEGGGEWPPLRPQTIRKKRRENVDPREMRATLALERSLTERGGPAQALKVSSHRVTLGSQLPYARRVTRRRPFVISGVARAETGELLLGWLTGAVV